MAPGKRAGRQLPRALGQQHGLRPGAAGSGRHVGRVHHERRAPVGQLGERLFALHGALETGLVGHQGRELARQKQPQAGKLIRPVENARRAGAPAPAQEARWNKLPGLAAIPSLCFLRLIRVLNLFFSQTQQIPATQHQHVRYYHRPNGDVPFLTTAYSIERETRKKIRT